MTTQADAAQAAAEPLNRATHDYSIEGLEIGVTYDARVIAVNAVGGSDPSEVLSAVVQPVSPQLLSRRRIGMPPW